MRAEANAGPVGGLRGVRERIAIFDKRASEFMGEVRMAAAMARPLREAEMRLLARTS